MVVGVDVDIDVHMHACMHACMHVLLEGEDGAYPMHVIL